MRSSSKAAGQEHESRASSSTSSSTTTSATRWWPMRRLLFLSSISLVACGSGGGCNGDECGPADAPDQPIIVGNGSDIMLQYGNFTSGVNNDCTDTASGVISITIHATQISGPGLLTFCVQRPDKFSGGVRIGDPAGLRIIDLNGDANGCSFTFEGTVPVTGMATARGICDNGKDPAGYALIVDGALSMRRNCPTVTDTVALTLTGTVAV